jgi:hypothetical protein
VRLVVGGGAHAEMVQLRHGTLGDQSHRDTCKSWYISSSPPNQHIKPTFSEFFAYAQLNFAVGHFLLPSQHTEALADK